MTADRTPVNLPQRLTGFTCVVDESGRILMVRHERLGVLRWELPGGHVEPGESVADAAIRETREEALIHAAADYPIAECRHAWRGAMVDIVYFIARPVGRALETDSREHGIHAVQWKLPADLESADTSPLAWPVIDLVARRDHRQGHPLLFEATHRRTQVGWEPVVTRSWCPVQACQRPKTDVWSGPRNLT